MTRRELEHMSDEQDAARPRNADLRRRRNTSSLEFIIGRVESRKL